MHYSLMNDVGNVLYDASESIFKDEKHFLKAPTFLVNVVCLFFHFWFVDRSTQITAILVLSFYHLHSITFNFKDSI